MTLPLYPDFKPLELADRNVIQGYFDRFPVAASEYSFGNNFIWRHYDRPRWTILNGNLCLIFTPGEGPSHAMAPIGDTNLRETLEILLDLVPRVERVPREVTDRLGEGLIYEPDRNEFDYVYAAADLSELKGRRFDGKRNRIRKFEREHAWKYLPLHPGDLASARALFEDWVAEKDGGSDLVQAQENAIQEALTHFEPLGFSGGAIEIDGRMAALSLGEPLTRDTAVIHIEIVSPCCEGLSQVMNREFVRSAWTDFAFINREQDLGLPGLRRAKLSYQPHHLVEKFRIRRP